VIGTTLGNYKLVQRLGGGGFSTVYQAMDVRGGAPVALKLLRQEYAEDADFLRRFQREAEIALSLPDNPHIAKPLEFGTYDGTPYFVVEYLDGQDLSEAIAGGRRLPVPEVLSIGLQVSDALQTAHRKGVVHRDIKPQNIRVTASGLLKVMDFGIARPPEGTRLTQTGAFIGTPVYIAPEVWEGQPADPRADIYALGVVLYEALGGRVPFGGETPAAIMREHLYGQPKALSSLRSDLPAGIESIVLKALARRPQDRFQSAGDLITALRNPGRPVALPKPPEQVPPRRPPPVPAGPAWRRFQTPGTSGVPQAYLVGAGSQLLLKPGATMIGRDPRSDIKFDDHLLSAQHARIELQGGQYVLRDLGSRNGSYVNGRRVQNAALLRHGDKLQVGQLSFTFVQSPAAMAGGPGLAAGASEQNLWAALCHASALFTIAGTAIPFVPALIPILIWLLAGRRSPLLALHAGQAFLFQMLVLAVLIITHSSYTSLIWLATTGYACFGAFRLLQGRDFRYPILGSIAALWK